MSNKRQLMKYLSKPLPRPAQAPGSAASMTQFDEQQTQNPPTAQKSRGGVEENSKVERKNIVDDVSHMK